MKLVTAFLFLCSTSLTQANPIQPGFMSVTIENSTINRDALERPFGMGIFLLKDYRWDIGNCIHLWNRETYDSQVIGAGADTFVPLSWQTFGFGIEFADLQHNSIISLSNSSEWTVNDLDSSWDYFVTCDDQRFGSITLRVSSQANGVPESAPTSALLALSCLGLFGWRHRLSGLRLSR